jgi:tRNA pseudouridine55 synthase
VQDLRDDEIEAAMASLRGEIMQIPPMYSAKKVKGQKLYELARRGEQIERQPVKVTISSFQVIEANGRSLTVGVDGTNDLLVRVVCSAGTYVRTLAEDLGKQLGMGAHLAALRRTRAGRFAIESAITLEELTELVQANSISDEIISLDATIGHLPAIVMNESDVRRVTNGVAVEFDSDHEDQQRLRLQNIAGELIAVGIYDAARRTVRPDVVLGN